MVLGFQTLTLKLKSAVARYLPSGEKLAHRIETNGCAETDFILFSLILLINFLGIMGVVYE